MRRRYLYLVGGFVSLAKPFLLGRLSADIGLLDSGGTASSLLRYLVFPQVVPAICLFFLFFDDRRYAAFRPLAAILALGSMFFFAAGAVFGTSNFGSLFLGVQDALRFSIQALAVFAIDLADALILLTGKSSSAPPPKEITDATGADSREGTTLPHEENK